jgi:hypothetical protein
MVNGHNSYHHHNHHQLINVPTAGAQAIPYGLHITRTCHNPPRGPSAGWCVLTTANVEGTNGLTYLPKHRTSITKNLYSQSSCKCLSREPKQNECRIEWESNSRLLALSSQSLNQIDRQRTILQNGDKLQL